MKQGMRYTERFKKDAASQVTYRGYTVKEVSGGWATLKKNGTWSAWHGMFEGCMP